MNVSHRREIAFIDRGVDDLATLLKGIRPDVEPILLSNDEPAPRQMARAVQGRDGLEAIHVIAHGRSGEVSFSSGAMSVEAIDQHVTDLGILGAAIRGAGDIRLWSCSVMRGARGATFVEAMARATGADVAAAVGRVGSAARGGSWGTLCACPPSWSGPAAATRGRAVSRTRWRTGGGCCRRRR